MRKKAGCMILMLVMLLTVFGGSAAASEAPYINLKTVSIEKGHTVSLRIVNNSKTVKWSSSDTKIATVSKGKVTGKKKGTVSIKAKAGKKTYTCKVNVSDGNAKSLVVYFSKSGTTRAAAKKIAAVAGADLLEIKTRKTYTSDYDKLLDIAEKEQKNNSRPAVSTGIKNLKQYDVIYLGYPIWWGKEPMAVRTFLEKYKWTGKTVRGVLRPAFQMAVDDDILVKTPFGFELARVVVNDTVTREAITKEQMRKFLKFCRDDNVYCKYYEAFYILFHTGMRISEFCGLTIKDIDLENNIINIDHQLQRLSDMTYLIQSTKTNAGTRKLPITDGVAYCFRTILEDRPTPKVEQFVDGYSGFLYLDKDGLPEVALHWEHRFRHAVNRYNEIYRVQMPKITPHICRHTYCSNMAKAGMNPKTLQYLMGHSDIGVTMNTYTHLGLEDAKEEMIRMEELNAARAELNKTTGEKPVTQKMFRAI